MPVIGPSERHLRKGRVVIGGDYGVKATPGAKAIDIGEQKMSSWEQIRLIDKNNYRSFYDEALGLISQVNIGVALVDKDGKQLPRVYSNRDSYGKKTDKNLYLVNNSYDINTIFNTDFYIRKPTAQNVGYYGGVSNPISLSDAELITDKRFLVDIVFSAVTVDENGNTSTTNRRKKERFIITKKSELDKEVIWATKDEIRKYVPVVLMDIQVGQKYFVVDKGVCEVAKVYDYPIKNESKICDVAYVSGVTETINIGSKKFVYIPLDYVNELAQFNESLNELSLQPRVSKHAERGLLNVIWQPIDEAARYIVKLYKYIDSINRRKVYFMKDYVVERNEQFVAIKDVIIGGNIIVVTAENREGEIIAQSRGIDATGTDPKWW